MGKKYKGFTQYDNVMGKADTQIGFLDIRALLEAARRPVTRGLDPERGAGWRQGLQARLPPPVIRPRVLARGSSDRWEGLSDFPAPREQGKNL